MPLSSTHSLSSSPRKTKTISSSQAGPSTRPKGVHQPVAVPSKGRTSTSPFKTSFRPSQALPRPPQKSTEEEEETERSESETEGLLDLNEALAVDQLHSRPGSSSRVKRRRSVQGGISGSKKRSFSPLSEDEDSGPDRALRGLQRQLDISRGIQSPHNPFRTSGSTSKSSRPSTSSLPSRSTKKKSSAWTKDTGPPRGSASRPIEVFSDTPSIESIVLMQSPPNKSNSTKPTATATVAAQTKPSRHQDDLHHSRSDKARRLSTSSNNATVKLEGVKDRSSRHLKEGGSGTEMSSTHARHKSTSSRGSAFGSHGKKVDKPYKRAETVVWPSGNAESSRVRTVEGRDTKLSSSAVGTSSKRDLNDRLRQSFDVQIPASSKDRLRQSLEIEIPMSSEPAQIKVTVAKGPYKSSSTPTALTSHHSTTRKDSVVPGEVPQVNHSRRLSSTIAPAPSLRPHDRKASSSRTPIVTGPSHDSTKPQRSSSTPVPASSHRRTSAISPLKRLKRSHHVDEDESWRPRSNRTSTTISEPSVSSRPKRERPKPGTYEIPQMDAPKWPSTLGSAKSSQHPSTKRKRESVVPKSDADSSASLTRTLPLMDDDVPPPRSSRRLSTPLSPAPHSQKSVGLQQASMSPLKSQKSSSLTVIPSSLPQMDNAPAGLDKLEDEESVEEVEEKTTDLLADFQDFDFAPESPKALKVPSVNSATSPRTPQSFAKQAARTPGSRVSALPNSPKTPSRRPTVPPPVETPKRLLTVHHPTPIKISPRYVDASLKRPVLGSKTFGLSDEIAIARAAAQRAREEEEFAKVREERARQMAKYDADAIDDLEEEELIEDLGDALAIITTESKDADSKPAQSTSIHLEPIKELRQSVRQRTVSDHSQSALGLKRRDVKPKPQQLKKRVSSGLDQLYREHKANERRGVSGPDAVAMLAAIQEAKARETVKRKGRAKGPYPTPPISGGAQDSGEDDEDDLTEDEDEQGREGGSGLVDGKISREELDKVIADMPEGLVDADMLRDATETREDSEQVDEVVDWFWDGEQKINTDYKVPTLEVSDVAEEQSGLLSLLLDTARQDNFEGLSMLLSSGTLDALMVQPAICETMFDWLLRTILIDHTASHLASLRHTLSYLLKRSTTLPRRILDDMLPLGILSTLGARTHFFPRTHPARPAFQVNLARDSAVSLAGDMIVWSLSTDQSLGHDRDLNWLIDNAVPFLALATDSTTPPSLQTSCLAVTQALLSRASALETPELVARALADAAKSVDAREREGREGSTAGSVTGCLDRIDPDTLGSSDFLQEVAAHLALSKIQALTKLPIPKSAGRIEAIQHAAEAIYRQVIRKQPDHDKIKRMTELFTISLGPMSAYMQLCMDAKREEGCEGTVNELRQAITSSMRKIQSRVTESVEHQNSSRLSQISVNLALQLQLAQRRWKREHLERLRGLKGNEDDERGMSRGDKGQLRLAFTTKS